MTAQVPRVALIGAPNAGKSTLYNRLVGRRDAMVHNRPGVTRDWREAPARWGWRLDIVDTPGYVPSPPRGVFDPEADTSRAMRATTRAAARGADACVLVVDGISGPTPLDAELARWLFREGKPALVCVTKCDREDARSRLHFAASLGLGEPIGVSAEHGLGALETLEALAQMVAAEPLADPPRKAKSRKAKQAAAVGGDFSSAASEPSSSDAPLPPRCVIMGRPNVGKSTLFNALLGSERALTGPRAGITRDPVRSRAATGAGVIMLVDTAGVRRAANRRDDPVEGQAVGMAFAAARGGDVCALVMDARAPWERQDLRLAGEILEAGRALTPVMNKSDLLDAAARRHAKFRTLEAERVLSPLASLGAPVYVQALAGWGLDKLARALVATCGVWRMRIGAGMLNRWLAKEQARHPPPSPGGRPLRLKYLTQVGASPPRFALFVNRPEDMPTGYLRSLTKGLRDSFGLAGVPVVIAPRASANPYVSRRNATRSP